MKTNVKDFFADKKKLFIVLGAALAAIIVIVGIILAIVLSGGDKDVYAVHVDLGDKYFAEEKYEEAVASYVIALKESGKETDRSFTSTMAKAGLFQIRSQKVVIIRNRWSSSVSTGRLI